MVTFCPSPAWGRVRSFYTTFGGGVFLNRILTRYLWIELALGIAQIVLGIALGGCFLPVLGACTLGLSAQCAARATRMQWASVALGVLSALVLAFTCFTSFLYAVSRSNYAQEGSSLLVFFLLAVIILIHSFMTLPLEDLHEVAFLRRGILSLAVFSGVAFFAIVLTYFLSYAIYDSSISILTAEEFLSNLDAGDSSLSVQSATGPQDFHYVEGVFAAAIAATGARAVLRTFTGRDGSKKGCVSDAK